jgi:type I restriction enzyme S subunit
MKADWKEYRLGDCATLLSGGTPSKSRNDYWDGDLPWVSCKDMKIDRIYDGQDHLSSLGAENGTRVVPEGTILFVVRGMILAKEFPVAIAKRPVAFNQDLKAVICEDFVETEFLYYWLKANSYEILGRADEAGHGTKRIQTDRLLSLSIRIPSPLVQRQIAGILSAYDDLIENNQRRIKILEEMARSLYREWFVHFRFPGHDKVKMVPSPLGTIPQGWEVKKLGEVLELNYGKALKSDTRREGQIPVFGSSGIVGSHDTSLVKGPGIIVGRKGNVGSVFWSDADFYPIDTAYFVTSSLPLRFMFYELQTKNFINNDAAVPGLSRHQAYSLEMVIPPTDLLTRFCRLANDFEQQASKLRHQIENLRRTRDLLLPRLLSGQVDLSKGSA